MPVALVIISFVILSAVIIYFAIVVYRAHKQLQKEKDDNDTQY